MKNVKNILFSLIAVAALLASTNLQAGCNTTNPQVGQTVGICKVVNHPDYSQYSCNVHNQGSQICYYNSATVQE
jgi:hypothetical protein